MMTNARFTQSITHLAVTCSATAEVMLDMVADSRVSEHFALDFIRRARTQLDFMESVVRLPTPSPDPAPEREGERI
jgi:hypothetical protein